MYAGDTAVENVFMIIFLMFNMALGAYILGTMTMLVVKGDEKTKLYRERVQMLDNYSAVHEIPKVRRSRGW